jgi:hypothetical protein
MHKSGPSEVRRKYFFFTGNTTYGVQNFEYDEFTGDYFACVYNGTKPQYPNYPMFVVDGSRKATEGQLVGHSDGVKGLILSLRDTGTGQGGIYGMTFPHGSMGLHSFGDGRFYAAQYRYSNEEGHITSVHSYRLTRENGIWELVEE